MVRQVVGKSQGGFTLVELMIVVVIVGILAMVAVPAYNDSMTKGRRSDAKSTLTTIAARQEQYFMDNKTYTADLRKLGYASANNVASVDGYYAITGTVNPAEPAAISYVLTAVPGNADDDCENFNLDETGAQGVTGSNSSEPELCW